MLSKNNSRIIMLQSITENEDGFADNQKTMSPYERQMYQLEHDPRTSKEILLGKRVRFYQIKKTLGTGNFSKVRLGVHLITKGITTSLHTVNEC